MTNQIWKKLGGGGPSIPANRNCDDYAWARALSRWGDGRREYAPISETIKTMPYGHHQICVFR